MTQISPRQTRDMAIHFTRMRTEARRERLLTYARDFTLACAVITAAGLSGYILGCAKATQDALPRIIAESQTRAAW